MARTPTFEQQIEDGVSNLEANPDFADHIWLTLYVSGAEANLLRVADVLSGQGWINVDGSEGGFIYPKIRSRLDRGEILALARSADVLCHHHQCRILNIDADTSPEVRESAFTSLFKA